MKAQKGSLVKRGILNKIIFFFFEMRVKFVFELLCRPRLNCWLDPIARSSFYIKKEEAKLHILTS